MINLNQNKMVNRSKFCTTPMEGINREAYKQILAQDGYAPLFAVTVGYADLSDFMHPSVFPKSRFELDEVVQSI